MTSSAAAGWALLRAGGHTGGGLEIPTIPADASTAAGPVRFAVGTNGEPRLLLPLTRHETPGSVDAGNGLSVSVSTFSHRGTPIRFVDLICVAPDLEPVFKEVADEMLERIGRGAGSADAVGSTIADFRALLVRTGPKDVSVGRVAGLIAELVVVNRLLDRSSAAWRAWRGPERDRHDFRSGNTSLEVKASLRPAAAIVTINGLEQLEAPVGGTLHLLHLVLEPVTGGILSVAGLARNALSKADETGRIGTLLAEAGCKDPDADEWNRNSFRLESERLYEIRPGFPRLTHTMLDDGALPCGVHDVTYTIDLSVADRFLCATTVYGDLETRLCP